MAPAVAVKPATAPTVAPAVAVKPATAPTVAPAVAVKLTSDTPPAEVVKTQTEEGNKKVNRMASLLSAAANLDKARKLGE